MLLATFVAGGIGGERVRMRFPGVRTMGGANVGALGCFATTRFDLRLVNLDGLVNNELCAAWQRGRVLAHFERNVDLIVMNARKR